MDHPLPAAARRTTSRLVLRPFAAGDAAARHAALSGRAEVACFLGDGATRTLAEVEAGIELHRQHWQREGFGLWGAFDAASGALVGQAGLLRLGDDAPAALRGAVEVVYALAPERWGHGLAQEAASAALALADELALDAVVALVRPANTRSLVTATRLGLVRVGEVAIWGAPALVLARHGSVRRVCDDG